MMTLFQTTILAIIVKTIFILENMKCSTIAEGKGCINMNINKERRCCLKTCENKESCGLDLFADRNKNHLCLSNGDILENSNKTKFHTDTTFNQSKYSTNFNNSTDNYLPQDKNEIKCDEGFVLQNFKILKNPKNNSEIGYLYTCLKLPIHGCVEINSKKVLISDDTNPFFLFNTTSLSAYTSENKAIYRFKLNIEHGIPSYFSYMIEVCKIGRRIECPVNIHPFKLPQTWPNVIDRLCYGCREFQSVLKRNESIESPFKNYRLTMQEDNNLVMYEINIIDIKNTTRPIWSTNTHNIKGEYHMFVDNNGLIVLANPNDRSDIIWTSKVKSQLSADHQPVYLMIRNTGFIGLFQCDGAYWVTNGWGKDSPVSYERFK